MKVENINTLESLSMFCHLCGLFSSFLGLVVSFFDIFNGDFRHFHVGLYVFITGYALVKISKKINDVLLTEKLNNTE